MTPDGGTTSARSRSVDRRSDQFGMETQHFLDVGRMCVERLDQGFAREDERLVKNVEVMHDAFAQATFRITQADDRSRSDFASGDAAGIGNGVSLSHERSGLQRTPVELSLMVIWRARMSARSSWASSSRSSTTS
jgi:hypothetical protein